MTGRLGSVLGDLGYAELRSEDRIADTYDEGLGFGMVAVGWTMQICVF